MTRTPRRCVVPLSGRAWLLGLLALSGAAAAQEVIVPPPMPPATPPAVDEIEAASPLTVIPPQGIAPKPPPPPAPLRWGPVAFRPRVFYQFLSGDGMQTSPGVRHSSIVQTVTPGLAADLGTHWTVDYAPSLVFYSNDAFRDIVNHEARLTGGTEYEDWLLGLSQTYKRTEDPIVETAAQTTEDDYATALTATWRFGAPWSLDLALNQDLRFIEQVSTATGVTADSREWSTMDWLNYEFWARFDAGLGLGVGYVNVPDGTDSVYERYQARVRWRATDKLSFQLHGGLEDRQFRDSAVGDRLNPVFGGDAQYLPVPTTALAVHARRTVSPSLFQDQIVETTDVTGDLTQRLLTRLYLGVGGGYHIIRYVAAAENSGAGRHDEYYSLDTRLSTSFLKRGTIAALYQMTGNSSNRTGFSYTSHQVGFEIGYGF